MQPTIGAYGDGLAKYFRADASSHLVISALRKSKLAVTRIRHSPGHGGSGTSPSLTRPSLPSSRARIPAGVCRSDERYARARPMSDRVIT